VNKACNRVRIVADDAEIVFAGSSCAWGHDRNQQSGIAASGAMRSPTFSGGCHLRECCVVVAWELLKAEHSAVHS